MAAALVVAPAPPGRVLGRRRIGLFLAVALLVLMLALSLSLGTRPTSFDSAGTLMQGITRGAAAAAAIVHPSATPTRAGR